MKRLTIRALGFLAAGLLIAGGKAQPLHPEVTAKEERARVVDGAEKVTAKLRDWLKERLPGDANPWVRHQDGRVYQCLLHLNMSAEELGIGKPGAATVPFAESVRTWASGLNRDLVSTLTRYVHESGNDPNFNPQTDCILSVTVTTPDGDSAMVRFVGEWDGTGPATGGEATIEVKLDKLEWSPRETVSGRFVIRNTGSTRFHTSVDGSRIVRPVRPDGTDAEHIMIMGCISPDMNAPVRCFIEASETRELPFLINTDRLNSMAGGYELPEGEWMIGANLADFGNVNTRFEPVRILVRAEPGVYTGPRILDAKPAGPNLIIVREDDSYIVIDPATGAVKGATPPDHGKRGSRWFGWRSVHSSDGRLIATLREANVPATLESLFGDRPMSPILQRPDGLAGSGTIWPVRFSEDDRELYATTREEFVAIDLQSGELKRSCKIDGFRAEFSSSGMFAARIKNGATIVLTASRGADTYEVEILDLSGERAAARVVRVDGHGDAPQLSMGRNGVYLTSEQVPGVRYVPLVSDKEHESRSFDTATRTTFAGESSDGKLVAFASEPPEYEFMARPTIIGVYQVSDGKRVCEIVCVGPSKAALVSSPPRVIVLPREQTSSSSLRAEWLRETALIYDALTGAKLTEVNLTPKPVPPK